MSKGEELTEIHNQEEETGPGAAGEGDDGRGENPSEEIDLAGLFEALLFLSNEPLPLSFFVKNLGVDAQQAKILLDSLVDEYEERDGGIRLVEISNGYQFMTSRRYSSQIRGIMGYARREGLSKGMLETLSIIAYKQPIVLAEIEELRGVSSRMMVANLMKKNLIKPVGRKELPGRPLCYGTTDEFLRYFGLNRLSDLPKLSEIKEFSFENEE
ncbi:MAG TPA: SMC-Scp complex subunit ScpB [Spirochaetota bacterium]|nr:SMC-Scp complex subunit ScpB [Spirochaetota bacterium]HNU90706.1 SMC-Scp complex subunit ScpB [Spirochaetota bacterium]HPV96623.1 SMC-Scp complex subunit ScpB [Spirochaetota bacterium]